MKTKTFILSTMILLNFLSCKAQNSNAIEAFKKSSHRISLERANDLKINHDMVIKPVLNEIQNDRLQRTEPFETTEFVWISLEDLKMYIEMLESVANANQKPISGIAFNFAAYDDNQQFPKGDNRKGDYRGRTALFLNPTFYIEGTNDTTNAANHKQFYIQPTDADSNEFVGAYIPIENWEKLGSVMYKKNTVMGAGGDIPEKTSSVDSGTSLAMDELNTMPPQKP